MRSMRVSKKGGKGPAFEDKWVKRVTYDEKPYFYNLAKGAGVGGVPTVSLEVPDQLKSAEERAKTSGEWVWVPHPSDVWQPAKVMKRGKDGSVQVQPYKGSTFTIPKSRVMEPSRETGNRLQEVPLWDVNFTAMEYLEDDVIQLDGVNEAMILHNIRERYAKGNIFTWVGAGRAVLLSVNPYQDMPELFNEDVMAFHKSQEDRPDKFVEPHVYAIANEAYDALLSHDVDQSILISGESGAGKTEATKHCLNFFAKQVGTDQVEHHVSEKLLLANPLLEAFGNAVTIRNNNSSRFGKWIEVTFSRGTKQISGAKFTNFMLEKTRVIHHQERERSFHIFYQLLQDAELAAAFDLGSPKDYAYLAQSRVSTSSMPTDAAEFETVKEAIKSLEFDDEEQSSMWGILAGILNLGNAMFSDQEQSSGVTGSVVQNEDVVSTAAAHLQVDEGKLLEVLTNRSISAGGEETLVALDAAGAKNATDAMAKEVYGRLFQYLVKNMNAAMAPPQESFFIGILDIFGFEVLENNSFEQLCINYANERLQQYFNQHTFDAEEQFYKFEGVNFEFLKFVDNQPVLNLLESKPKGMMLMLDDECTVPNGSDKGWLGKVEKLYEADPNFETDFRKKFESTLSFQINHYAGRVEYDASDFVVKNKDTVWNNVYSLLSTSQDKILQVCFPKRATRSSNIKPVAAQFRGHVTDLIKLIKSTESRFVRCVKPNDAMAPQRFEGPLVVEQLRYSGVFETIEIRKGGYPFRLTHKQFAYRFGGINGRHKYAPLGADGWKQRCQEILDVYPEDLAKDCAIGKSMVLYRVNVYKPLLLARNLAIEVRWPEIQAFVRGAIGRFYFSKLHAAQMKLQDALDTANDIAMVREGFAMVDAVQEWLEPNLSFLPAYPMHLHAKCKHLESRLMAWEELEDTLNQRTEGMTPAKVSVDLYKELIELCRQADEDLADVKRTAAQQEVYEFSQELIRDSEPGQLDAESGPALASLDRARMQAVKDRAEAINYITKTTEEIMYILARLVYLDIEAPEALELLDSVRMKTALDEANQYNHTSEAFQEIERLFALPEKEFVKMELEAAKRLGDRTREIHRRIRLREIFYDEEGDKYADYTQSGHMREPANFAAGAGMCGRTAIMLSMRKWSPKPIPSPLTVVPGELVGEKQDSKEIKALKKVLKTNFVNIQKYMGDKKGSNVDKFAQQVVSLGVENPDTRNEIYFQLIKQLTENPSQESREKGYDLLGLCMAAFLPSSGFEHYLVMWLRQHPPDDGNWHPYTAALHKLQFAEEDDLKSKPKTVDHLRRDFKALREEGSRFSIAVDAFTGPSAQAVKKKIAMAQMPQE